ncbi:FAD-binding protein [Alkalicaulis satelles]|uniref:FAD-binding protein n=1 Tax=Alkalicaulis satelles TaxID=2609175 RepID=A0A5M6ZNZ4_9PROT|nr:FAD-dependent monooxygenase [Alkalicaulis satelles]KAA5803941.1 FAD-binding protein [Alkalicaulis satelles]
MSKAVFSGDVIVSGGGLAGLTLALALHRAGLAVAVVDALALDARTAPAFDGRASALAYTSWRVLEAVGAADHLQPHARRIEDILVVDSRPLDGLKRGGPGPDQLHFDRREIHPEDDGEPLGWMAENRHTRLALARAADTAGLTVFAPARVTGMEDLGARARVTLDDGRMLEAAMVAACDGKASPLREQAVIRTFGRRYNQDALVLTVEHERDHQGVAYEVFMPAGPFAILPLPGKRSSLVWTERTAAAHALETMDEAGFQEALEARFGDFLGAVRPVSQRWRYPLGLRMAERFHAPRLALVGDAARAIHPIAGQGFNLGIRDAAALADGVVEAKRAGLDIGSEAVLGRYDRWRRTDSAALALGTDAINALFANDHAMIRTVRGLGLSMVDRIPAARRFFMRTAGGETGDLPALLRGEPLSL